MFGKSFNCASAIDINIRTISGRYRPAEMSWLKALMGIPKSLRQGIGGTSFNCGGYAEVRIMEKLYPIAYT